MNYTLKQLKDSINNLIEEVKDYYPELLEEN